MSEYFSEPKYLNGRVKLELDLSNYATRTNLKNATSVDPSMKWWDSPNIHCPHLLEYALIPLEWNV